MSLRVPDSFEIIDPIPVEDRDGALAAVDRTERPPPRAGLLGARRVIG
ncbi:MAG: hypothetical protein HIU86_08495 [Acidobacteria bacterium]|nr:hypothetical protein [Acidobacteriota bacterium]